MKRLLIAALIVTGMCAPALAHSTDLGSYTFSTIDPIQVDHTPDADPFKGYAYVETVNNTEYYWVGFHFDLLQITSEAVFVDSGDGIGPVECSQSPFTYQISSTQLEVDFDFASDMVAPGETATFKVWTDNTVNQQPFAIAFYPSIPEPATMSLLGLAGLALLRRRR